MSKKNFDPTSSIKFVTKEHNKFNYHVMSTLLTLKDLLIRLPLQLYNPQGSLWSSQYLHTLSECIREIVRQRQFLHELGAPQQGPTFVGEDNSGTLTYAHSEKLSDRSMHVHALVRHIKEEQRDRIIDAVKVHTKSQWADMDTKTLTAPVFDVQKKVRLGTAGGPPC